MPAALPQMASRRATGGACLAGRPVTRTLARWRTPSDARQACRVRFALSGGDLEMADQPAVVVVPGNPSVVCGPARLGNAFPFPRRPLGPFRPGHSLRVSFAGRVDETATAAGHERVASACRVEPPKGHHL